MVFSFDSLNSLLNIFWKWMPDAHNFFPKGTCYYKCTILFHFRILFYCTKDISLPCISLHFIHCNIYCSIFLIARLCHRNMIFVTIYIQIFFVGNIASTLDMSIFFTLHISHNLKFVAI